MKICDLSDIEDLILTKAEIEKALIENNVIEKKYSLEEFILNIVTVSHNVFMHFNVKESTYTTFALYNFNNEHYIFNIDTDPDKLEQLAECALKCSSFENVTDTWASDSTITDILVHQSQFYKISL